MVSQFTDRADAGSRLARLMTGEYAGRDDLLLLGLPRGGVPVAAKIAEELDARLDLLLVRKLGLPGHEELAMGAIASGGAQVLNRNVLDQIRVSDEAFQSVLKRERAELERREKAYRGNRPSPEYEGRCVILVDDGLATGSTMLAAVEALRGESPAHLVVAAPVAPIETIEAIRQRNDVDDVICALTPEVFGGVGRWYRNFDQTTDQEVRSLLDKAWGRQGATSR